MTEKTAKVIMIAAPNSGSGKTTISAAMAHYWSSKGLSVKVFKVGPDYIDPLILAKASSHHVYQIDLWMTGEEQARDLIESAALNSDIVIVESMMGLYDGYPSSADLAAKLNIPIVLVVDVSAMAETFGAIVHGLSSYRDDIFVCGVIGNKVASNGHLAMLKASLKHNNMLANLPFNQDFTIPERHLGLYQAAEIGDLSQKLTAIAKALDLDSVLSCLPAYQGSLKSAVSEVESLDIFFSKPLEGYKIAVSRDQAFQFVYQANIDCLIQLGAQVIDISPLTDKAIPDDIDALYLVGGYPELEAKKLSENVSFLAEVRNFVNQNKPVVAECGGFMYLQKELATINNEIYPMAGVFNGQAIMSETLSAIGLQYANIDDQQIKGHAFHYSNISDIGLQPIALSYYHNQERKQAEAIYKKLSCIGSYMHFYFPSNPRLIADWFSRKTCKL